MIESIFFSCTISLFVLALIAGIKNEWTYRNTVRLNALLYRAVRERRISREEFMVAHQEFPDYGKVADDLTGWKFAKYLSPTLLKVWEGKS